MIKVYNMHIAIVGLKWRIFREKTSFIEEMKVIMFYNSFKCYKVVAYFLSLHFQFFTSCLWHIKLFKCPGHFTVEPCSMRYIPLLHESTSRDLLL